MVFRKAMALFHANSTKCNRAALLDYTKDIVVGCYRFPDGLRPLLPAVNALLIAPPGDVVGLERAFELLCSSQIIAAIAHEHSGISTPRHRRYE